MISIGRKRLEIGASSGFGDTTYDFFTDRNNLFIA